MYYWKICGSGGHVFMRICVFGRTCLLGWHVLQVDMSCGKSCILGYLMNKRLCLKVKSILRLEMSNLMTCFVRF